MKLFWWPGAPAALLAVTLSLPACFAAAAEAEADAAPNEATLQVFNRDIITFLGVLLGNSAPDRARRAQTRVDEQIAAPGAHKVALQLNALGTLVQIDGATTFVVTADDTDTLAQERLDVAQTEAASALEFAISETCESRDLDAVARGITRAAGATAVLALALWLMWRAQRAVGLPPYLPGAQTEAFKGVSVLVGLMISLGASNLVGQAASGLIPT